MNQFTNGELCRDKKTVRDAETLKDALVNAMVHQVGRDPDYASPREWFYALAFVLRGILSEDYIHTARTCYREDTKRLYYLSMEYLPGALLTKHLLDLEMLDQAKCALEKLGQSFDAVREQEVDPGLGNGGLGRLAACILDSLATHRYPGYGYGIRYDYGMFTQRIEKGQQIEHPEHWLRYGNPWEFERASIIYPVRYYGRVVRLKKENGEEIVQWVDAEDVIAMAFDVPMSGYRSGAVTNLRLWAARSSRDFDLHDFNEGNYVAAVRSKTASENLSKVLYPNDSTQVGQELRLKQEYFFVCASIQDIIGRYMRKHDTLDHLPDEVVLQLNDTHPSLAVPELMRLLLDVYGYPFNKAWDITRRTFRYTNHTLLPEALETWSIDLLNHVLPRHMEIIYEINDVFLREIRRLHPGDGELLSRVSLIDDARRAVRMAHVAIVASEKVNGVANLHTELLRSSMFPDFDRIFPKKFLSITNGITQRRWLLESNPRLSALISDRIGDAWTWDLSKLKGLEPLAEDKAFRQTFREVKLANKQRLAHAIFKETGVRVDPASLFDVQVKRIHEYKRQLLNLLHVVTRYARIRENPVIDAVPRTVIIAGKAAPAYHMAKQIIRLINDVAETINNDPLVGDRLKLVFYPNYNVSAAEVIIPGADLSEQISTAGTEASGTGNMKLSVNGALTIGTLDGANVEIHDDVGADNIFIFGLTTQQAQDLRVRGYDPWYHYNHIPELRKVLDMISNGYFCPEDTTRHRGVVDALLRGGDHYLLLADYASYIACQEQVDDLYRHPDEWTRRAILNVANMGRFSIDRTVQSYVEEVWDIKKIEL